MLENTCKDISSGSKYENTLNNFTRTHEAFFTEVELEQEIEVYKKKHKLSEKVTFHYKEILILFPDLNIHHDKIFAFDHNSEDCYTQEEVSTLPISKSI